MLCTSYICSGKLSLLLLLWTCIYPDLPLARSLALKLLGGFCKGKRKKQKRGFYLLIFKVYVTMIEIGFGLIFYDGQHCVFFNIIGRIHEGTQRRRNIVNSHVAC